MVSLDVFLLGLMAVSTLTGFVTEAVKKVLVECNVNYRANLVAGIVAAILGMGLGIGYAVVNGMPFNGATVVCVVALMFMGWLGSMIGYDKVTALLKTTKKD